ncbi:Protein of unknown function [Clostridium cavendishii DSM 21758]|uniref:SMODS and SLOG-associating 2TM effector domain-containing protein n=1 Tax=Clostridium cavendishii DSM 21758 TaxID=1121302 RepID=A0A1M6GKT3_9CLOT|nr:DUF4231 domain-containing protein [Clostridium cavendishii]SHJ10561.1 Protein of unknown function [Clostridium cavendishii DSM 21758]
MKQSSELNFYKNILDDLTNKEYITKMTSDIAFYKLEWYINKADGGRARYNLFNISIIILTAIIPLVNVFNDNTKIINSAIAVLINILISVSYLKNYKLSWLRYRQAVENIGDGLMEILIKCSESSEKKNYDDEVLQIIKNISKADVDNWNKHIEQKNEKTK